MQPSTLNLKVLQAKIQTKRDLYMFLDQDCKAFLPSQKSTNCYFLSAILKGIKNYVRRDKVRIASVPNVDGLTTESFLSLAKNSPVVMSHLPDERDWGRIDRHWLCNILFTLETEKMQNFIDDALKQRQAKQDRKENLNVSIRPEFAAAFAKCLNFASHKGKACSMLKDSARRKRTRIEFEESKQEVSPSRLFKQTDYQGSKRLNRDLNPRQEMQYSLGGANNPSSASSRNQSKEGFQMLDQSISQAQFII